MPRIPIAISCPRSGASCATVRPPKATRDGVTVRNDTGVAEGGEISLYYDPMIAKLVTHAKTRAAAIDAQADALDAFTIEGIRHNIPFLAAIMQHPRWRAGQALDRLHRRGISGRLSSACARPARWPARSPPSRPPIDHVLGERKRRISGQLNSAVTARAPARDLARR